MSDENSQFDSLNEQTRLIKISLKYTNGDLDKAKLMASGQNDDVSVIKGRFASDSVLVYGIFIVFINFANGYTMNVNTLIMATKDIFEKAKIFDSWKSFYSDFGNYIKEMGDEALDSHDFTTHLADSIGGYDIFSRVDGGDLDSLTADLKEIIGKFLDDYRIQCQIAVEKTSSLMLELEGIPVETPERELPIVEAEEPIQSNEDRLMAQIEKEAEYLVGGRVIVSPVRGKNINDIKTGESIRVLLSNRDETTVNIAKNLNALSEDDDYLPIKARIKAKIPLAGGGCIIYGVIAKNVIVKVVEEENVKIEVDSIQGDAITLKSESHLLLYVALLLGLIALSLFAVLYTL
jgi:hypothetical protein